MSAARPEEAAAAVRRFEKRLLSLQVPLGRLSPIEERLLAILPKLYVESVLIARMGRTPLDAELAPVTTELVVEGMRFAVAAAIEAESHLRKIREHVEG